MDVTVVGSGPNGLAAAVVCARAGLAVQVFEARPTPGGAARTLPDAEYAGVVHDIGSAVHPMASASTFFTEFDLPARGVELGTADIAYANPLEGRPAAIAYQDLDRTCAELADGASWRDLLGPLAERADGVLDLVLGDRRSLPGDVVAAGRLGRRILEQGTRWWGRLEGDDARALFTGVAAHGLGPMPSIGPAAIGLTLAMLAHTVGWPVPVGGSQAISDALITDLENHGGILTTGHRVTEPPDGVVLYDTAPTALLSIYGDRLPGRYARALRRYRYGAGGVAKVDYVLSGDIPWTDQRSQLAPTLHLGGTRTQMAVAEADVAAGRHAEWPMILAASPHVVDPGRIDAGGRRPFWTYAHVPFGSSVDQAEVITSVVERLAPGFRDVVVAVRSTPAADLSNRNANLVGGDITLGGLSLWKAVVGPTPRFDPWTTPIPRAYLCSSATPPGGGVHGMSGYYAARTALRREFGIEELPDLAP